MLKKVLIITGAIVVLIVIALAYLNYRNYSLSPRGKAELTKGDLAISVTYSRPSVRGRLIFGAEEDEALQPYGQYWRLGANEATEISFNRDVLFNGEPVKKGVYRMYAIPGPESFVIGLNTGLGKWGAMEPDYELDILQTNVKTESGAPFTEQHTISLEASESGINVIVAFENVRLSIPVTPR